MDTSQDRSVKGDGLLQTSTIYDGLGRTIHATDSSGAKVDTVYDALGRVQTISNPHFADGSLSDGVTGYSYDALGRKLLQCQPDNGATFPCKAGTSYLQWIYNGNKTDSYDENRNYWSRTADALGRITKVLEPDGSTMLGAAPTLETDYRYNALDNLSSVLQKGKSSDAARSRSFTYDSLSRLFCASNPENSQNVCPADVSSPIPSSVTSYIYDLNGNVGSRTDARGVITSYSYDALNRLTSKTYSGNPGIASITPPSTFKYDDASVTNGIGRLTAEFTGTAAAPITRRSITAYDLLGRIKSETQCVGVSCTKDSPDSPTYTYDLSGNLVSYGNLLGTTQFTNGYDSAGRLSTLSNLWLSTAAQATPPYSGTLFSSPSYTPFGALSGATYAAGLSMNRIYDSRLRVIKETDTSIPGNTPATPGRAVISITGGVQAK